MKGAIKFSTCPQKELMEEAKILCIGFRTHIYISPESLAARNKCSGGQCHEKELMSLLELMHMYYRMNLQYMQIEVGDCLICRS